MAGTPQGQPLGWGSSRQRLRSGSTRIPPRVTAPCSSGAAEGRLGPRSPGSTGARMGGADETAPEGGGRLPGAEGTAPEGEAPGLAAGLAKPLLGLGAEELAGPATTGGRGRTWGPTTRGGGPPPGGKTQAAAIRPSPVKPVAKASTTEAGHQSPRYPEPGRPRGSRT